MVFGAMLEDLEETARERGLHAVIGIHANVTAANADGIFMHDRITPDLRCGFCGADPFQDVEVEYADTCMYCGCTPEVREIAYYVGNREANRTDWVCTDCPAQPVDEEQDAFAPIGNLHDAARDGNVEAVRTLLDSDVPPDGSSYKYARGEAALMWAAGEGHLDVMGLLLERGADVNARNESGWTALFNAASTRNVESVRFLIEAGANVGHVNKDGRTALDLAGDTDDEELVRLLQQARS
jgi:hypothetical protein